MMIAAEMMERIPLMSMISINLRKGRLSSRENGQMQQYSELPFFSFRVGAGTGGGSVGMGGRLLMPLTFGPLLALAEFGADSKLMGMAAPVPFAANQFGDL